MAKLFSTISLENRYKSSLNNIEMKQLPEAITMPTDVANTSFRTTISLGNRLTQPLLGTTTHLPEYILSDQHTDYLKIKNFGVYEQTSNIVINPITSKPNQGSVALSNTNTIINQGGVTINTPTYDSLLLEGASLSNGVYTSKTNITPSISVQNASVLQGLGTNPTPSISSTSVGVLQGLGTNPTLALATEPINIPTSIVLSQPTQVEPIKTPINLTQGPSPVGTYEKTPQQGNNMGKKVGVTSKKDQSPALDAAIYEADRALAYYIPTIKHGSTDIVNFNPTIEQGSTDAQKYTSPNNTNNVVYPNVKSTDGGSVNSNIAQILGSDDENRNDQKLDNLLAPIKDIPGNNTGTKSSLKDYTTLTYDQIVKRSVDVDNNYKVKDYREDILEVNQKNFINGKTPSAFIASSEKSTENAKTLAKPSNDFILFQVRSLVDQKQIVSFRAFITSFSDSFNLSWNDITYVGRQDVLKTFKNTTRTGTIGFKIAAFNIEELRANYTKLSDFIKIAAVGRGGVGDTYITGPLCQLTVGRWFKNTPCIFGSVKFDTQPTEYSWEIDGAEVPHVVDVTVDFTVLGDVNGESLNASTNKYFDYIN